LLFEKVIDEYADNTSCQLLFEIPIDEYAENKYARRRHVFNQDKFWKDNRRQREKYLVNWLKDETCHLKQNDWSAL